MKTITEHRDILDKLADELVEREEVPGKEVMEWLNGSLEDGVSDDNEEIENNDPADSKSEQEASSDEKTSENEEESSRKKNTINPADSSEEE